MRVTQEKIQQYVGIKYGKDIANELKNRVQVVIDQLEYSLAIKTRHVKYEALVRAKQTNLLTAMQTQLATLQQQVAAAVGDTDLVLSTAKMQHEIADLQFEVSQDVPYKLTSEEAAVHYNLGKSYSVRQDKLVMVRGQVFALIYDQCTQLLQDKMKQEKNWIAVSASYNTSLSTCTSLSRALFSNRPRINILWPRCGSNIVKSTMQSKVATTTLNGTKDSIPMWKLQSLLGACLPTTRL